MRKRSHLLLLLLTLVTGSAVGGESAPLTADLSEWDSGARLDSVLSLMSPASPVYLALTPENIPLLKEWDKQAAALLDGPKASGDEILESSKLDELKLQRGRVQFFVTLYHDLRSCVPKTPEEKTAFLQDQTPRTRGEHLAVEIATAAISAHCVPSTNRFASLEDLGKNLEAVTSRLDAQQNDLKRLNDGTLAQAYDDHARELARSAYLLDVGDWSDANTDSIIEDVCKPTRNGYTLGVTADNDGCTSDRKDRLKKVARDEIDRLRKAKAGRLGMKELTTQLAAMRDQVESRRAAVPYVRVAETTGNERGTVWRWEHHPDRKRGFSQKMEEYRRSLYATLNHPIGSLFRSDEFLGSRFRSADSTANAWNANIASVSVPTVERVTAAVEDKREGLTDQVHKLNEIANNKDADDFSKNFQSLTGLNPTSMGRYIGGVHSKDAAQGRASAKAACEALKRIDHIEDVNLLTSPFTWVTLVGGLGAVALGPAAIVAVGMATLAVDAAISVPKIASDVRESQELWASYQTGFQTGTKTGLEASQEKTGSAMTGSALLAASALGEYAGAVKLLRGFEPKAEADQMVKAFTAAGKRTSAQIARAASIARSFSEQLGRETVEGMIRIGARLKAAGGALLHTFKRAVSSGVITQVHVERFIAALSRAGRSEAADEALRAIQNGQIPMEQLSKFMNDVIEGIPAAIAACEKAACAAAVGM